MLRYSGLDRFQSKTLGAVGTSRQSSTNVSMKTSGIPLATRPSNHSPRPRIWRNGPPSHQAARPEDQPCNRSGTFRKSSYRSLPTRARSASSQAARNALFTRRGPAGQPRVKHSSPSIRELELRPIRPPRAETPHPKNGQVSETKFLPLVRCGKPVVGSITVFFIAFRQAGNVLARRRVRRASFPEARLSELMGLVSPLKRGRALNRALVTRPPHRMASPSRFEGLLGTLLSPARFHTGSYWLPR